MVIFEQVQLDFDLDLCDIFLQGKEIAESARQHVQPEDELQVGSLIEEYEKPPSDKTIHIRTQGRFRDVKRVSGKVLDENVQSGR